jgi:hypothetical protein
VIETLDDVTRNAVVTLLCARIDEQWFGLAFPNQCGDGYPYAGTDFDRLRATLDGYGLLWPPDVARHDPPDDGRVFDVLEFAYEFVAEPKDPSFHSYMSHSHYTYDREAGRARFADDVNRIFERNGMAFALRNGEVERTVPSPLHEALAESAFRTGDDNLDRLLDAARQKFLHRSVDVRRESLEKLWDAWERLKTLEPGRDKKESAHALLEKAADEPLRTRLEQEARDLTDIGNTFMIRHAEKDKVPIVESQHIDYLFHRMFSLIALLLKASGRG